MYVRTDGRLEIHPCVLQDIGPLGLLPKKDQRKNICRKIKNENLLRLTQNKNNNDVMND